MVVSSSLNVDAPRLLSRAPTDRDLDDAVDVACLDLVGEHIVRKRDYAAERPVESLLAEIGSVLAPLQGALARDGKHVLLDRQLERFRVDAGSEEVDGHRLRCGGDVDGGKRAGRKGPDVAP